jgi:hypothetical protein
MAARDGAEFFVELPMKRVVTMSTVVGVSLGSCFSSWGAPRGAGQGPAALACIRKLRRVCYLPTPAASGKIGEDPSNRL